ncbi:MAG: signal peptidase II [Candidatus Omnitrophota bacterium]
MLLLTLFILAADQATKYMVLSRLDAFPADIWPGVFSITPVFNTGGAFGVFRDFPALFLIVPSAAIALVIVMILRIEYVRRRGGAGGQRCAVGYRADEFSLCLILAGAAGNMIDRVRLGYVVDFLDFKVWPVFNIADSAITIGMTVLVIRMLIQGFKRRAAK